MTKLCEFCWRFAVLIAAVLTIFAAAPTDAVTLTEIINNKNVLNEFATLLAQNELGKTLLKHTSVTVFAPTNAAFEKYRGSHKSLPDLILYHIVKSSVTSDNFPVSLASEMLGGLPIWVRRNLDENHLGSPKYEYYANNALIIQTDLRGVSVGEDPQVLHIIDEVLDPIMPIPDDPAFRNPSAYKIITDPNKYDIAAEFSELVRQMQVFEKERLVQGGEGNTFFLPVNGNNLAVWNKVDGKVIDAHIIADQVFFTRAFPTQPQESMAFSDMLKSSILITNETSLNERTYEFQVQSNTAIGYDNYPKGVVVARVIKANIPVRNGVVHIIENPLVVNNKNVVELLEQNQNLGDFSKLLNKHSPDILDELRGSSVTLFAPSNKAFEMLEEDRFRQILTDDEKIKQMLRLHVISRKLNSEQITRDGAMSVPSSDRLRNLHISYNSRAITVLGGGVNATVTMADIGAVNGYVHVINRILGIPYHTIYEKLNSDQGLSDTFRLGNLATFNNQFTNLDIQFTYFVPHNEAWKKVEQQHKSEYYKLFSKEYSYQAIQILQRHLIVNQRFSLAKLLDQKSVQMLRGTFQVKKIGTKHFVEWEGETAEIMDPDIETTNGVVHVIRNVLFKRRDLTNEATTASQVHMASFTTILLSTALVKFIV